MSQATPQMHVLAKRLVTHEARQNKSSGKKSRATFPVCEKLRAPLAALVGRTGFGALLARALALAGPEVPWLRAVQVKADGSLEGMAELETQFDPKKIAEGRVVLLAHLLGLIQDFIGENLTMRLIREVWPKLFVDEMSFASGDANEINS